MLLGPRNQKQTGLEHLTNPQAYDQLQRRQKQKQLLTLINEKDHTITILHQINTRLGAELALLQKKLGIDHQVILKELQNLKQISVGFHYEIQQLQYLDNLFKAYDENNIKQKKLIALLYTQLQDSERKAENIVKDNQFLLNQMQNKCKQILQIYQKGFPEDNLVQTYSTFFITKLLDKLQRQTQIDLMQSMREENQYLVKYSQQLEQKYLKLQIEYEQSRNTAEKYFQTFKSQSEQLKQAFIKVDDLIKVKQVLEKKFDQISHQNIQLESTKQLLESKVTRLQQQLKNSKNQYFSTKKANRQDLDKVQSELDSLKIQYQNISKRQRESFNKIMILQRQTEGLRDSNRGLKRDLQKTKSDFENTIKMLEAYETKITNSEKKMQAMRQFVDENKQNLDRIILQKDKAQLKIQQLQKQNQNLRNKHLDEASNLKLSFQRIINNLNQKIQVLEQSKEDLATEMHQRQISLKNEHEKLKRMNNDLRSQNSNLLNSMKSNSGSEIVIKIRELEDKNQNLTKMINQYERRIFEEKEIKEEVIDNLKQEIKDLANQLEKERNSTSNSLRELTQVKSKLSIINNEKECVENQLTRLKRLFDQKNMNNVEQRDWKVKQLQQKLQQAVQKQKAIRREAIEKLQKYDQTERELEMQYKNIINALERQIQELKRKLRKRKETN